MSNTSGPPRDGQPRDTAYWAQYVSTLKVTRAPTGALNLNVEDGAQRRRCHTDRAHHGLEAPLSRVLAQAISFLSIAVRHCSGGSGPH